MKKQYILFILTLVLNVPSFSQNLCGPDIHNQYLFSIDSSYSKKYKDQEREIVATKSTQSCPDLKIRVVFHIVHNTGYPAQLISNNTIDEALAILNEDFNRTNPDASLTGYYGGYFNPVLGYWVPLNYNSIAANPNIEFCLGGITYDQTAYVGFTTGSTAGAGNYNGGTDAVLIKTLYPHSEFSSNEYLKVWVCNLTDYAGYATFPGAPDIYDGVTVNYSVLGASNPNYATLTHETGHWLGLRHIWGDQPCGDDFVTDTYPADTHPTLSAPYGPSTPSVTSCSDYMNYSSNWAFCVSQNYGYAYVPMFDNYMDYSNSECMNFFSNGQKARMEYYIDLYRSNLCTISAGSTCITIGIDENNSTSNKLIIYPNPANDRITIDGFDGNTKSYIIYNISGKIIEQGKTNGTLDVSALSAGIYFLAINNNKVKLIISH